MKKITTSILFLICIALNAQTFSDSLLTKKLVEPNNPELKEWTGTHSARTLSQIQKVINVDKQNSITNITNKLNNDKDLVTTSKLKRKIKGEQLASLDSSFNEELKNQNQYYDELPNKIITYIDSYENYKEELANQKEAIRIKKEETAEILRRQKDSINQNEREIEVKKLNDDWYAIPKSSAYITWKAKYENYIKSAKMNVKICESVKNKHSFINRWGQKLVDIDAFPKVDKILYNKNRNEIQSKINAINDLIYNGTRFNDWYNGSATDEQSVALYKLQQFLNNNSESY